MFALTISYFDSASTPSDNGSASGTTQSVAPPASMQKGQIVLAYGIYRGAAAPTMLTLGGQLWTRIALHNANPRTLAVYWCVFNGTWTADPSMTAASTDPLSVILHVIAGSNGANSIWRKDAVNGPSGVGAAATNTLNGVDPTAAPNITVGIIATPDDNTFSANSLGSFTFPMGSNQYRNTAGSDQAAAFLYFIQNLAHAATGNAVLNQATQGNDAYTRYTLAMLLMGSDDPAVQTRNAWAIANDASVGTNAWSSTEKASLFDGESADVAVSAGVSTNYLKFSDFKFDIPDGATIDGIEVMIRRTSFSTASPTDDEVKIVKGGSIGSENKANGNAWANSFESTDWEEVTYGGEADLWSEDWTADDINDPDFGLVINIDRPGGGTSSGSIDTLVMTIYYTEGGGSLIKTFNGLANASTKTINGLANASVKSKNGLTNV